MTSSRVFAGDAQSVTIGREARRLSPASIDVLQWLFDHDPATLRELQAELTLRYGQQPFETAIGELLRRRT